MPSSDSLTVLASKGPLLTKRWTANGIQPYDRAKHFEVANVPVDDIKGLHLALADLERVPTSCAIRGEWAGAGDWGNTQRTLEFFKERPRHWVCLDVDGWEMPIGKDLGAHAGEVVQDFVRHELPIEFHGASFHWQLSSSAGKPGSEHLLKAHLWFWLSEPRSGEELETWARALQLPVDVTVFRTVQIHYTAAPIFDPGIADPIPVRSGFVEGLLREDVELVLPDVTELPRASRASRAGMADPTEKPGLIGAFCRLYPPSRVIDEDLCEGHFGWEGDSETRITWKTSASGSPGGVCVTDDELHLYCSHNDDPFAGRACNAWDFVRQHRFGGLDADLEPDVLDFMRTAGGVPSERAMREWARALPDVAEELARAAPAERAARAETTASAASQVVDERAQALARALTSVTATGTVQALETVTAVRLAACEWLDTERATLAQALQSRAKDLGAKLPIATVRQWLAPPVTSSGLPDLDPDTGRPLATLGNLQALAAQERVTMRYNTMTKEAEILVAGESFSTDNAGNASLAELYSRCKASGMRINMGELVAFVLRLADGNQFNPPLTWIESSPWDGVDRLPAWYDTVRVPPDKLDLKQRLMRRWALQSVAILHNQGDMMARGVLVFGGPQNQGKGKWLKSLAPYGMVGDGVQLDPHNKDTVKLFVRYWLTELGEIDTIVKRSDVGALKNIISLSTDKFRAPYAARESIFPRRTSPFGTVNDLQFLQDPTGNTRFWVLEVESVNAHHGIDMQQLWAQILAVWKTGEQHWLNDEEVALLNESNGEYVHVDSVEEGLRQAFPWGDPEAEMAEMTATRAIAVARLPMSGKGLASQVGAALRRISGRKPRKTNGQWFHTIPVRPGQELP